ncbi:MAG: winged helix DNA-binding domain-containing protein [Candidatus Hermodarchaeia archaeon]
MPKVKDDTVSKYLLHKQHLLDSSLADSVLDVVNDILGLHATSASTPYLSLFARMKQFQRGLLDRELYVNRKLIRLSSMRHTLFILPTTLAPIVFQATRAAKFESERYLKVWGIPHSEFQRIADSIYEALKDGPQPLRIIKQTISPGLIRTIELPAGKQVARMSNVNVVMTVLVQQGKVFSEKYSDSLLTRHANRYALRRTIYPQLDLESVNADEAQLQLVKRYIGIFGPVTEEDAIWWIGVGKGQIRTALAALEPELEPIQIKGYPHEYVMLKSDYKTMKRFKAPRTLPALLLPYEDPFTKGYWFRDRFVKSEHENQVYVKGEAQPTVWVNGKIIGTWNRVFEKPGETLTIQLFRGIGRKEKTILTNKAHAMLQMMTRKDGQVVLKTP